MRLQRALTLAQAVSTPSIAEAAMAKGLAGPAIAKWIQKAREQAIEQGLAAPERKAS